MPKKPYCEHPSYYGCATKNDSRYKKWKRQYNKRGFDDTETWSFDCTLIEFIKPRLKATIAEIQATYERDPKTLKEYDELVECFSGEYDVLLSEEEQKKFDRGFELLAKHYKRLWW